MKQTHVFLGSAILALAFFAISARQATSQIQVLPSFVRLQATTPGSTQNGHSHINGKMMAGGLEVFDTASLGVSFTSDSISFSNTNEDPTYHYSVGPEKHQFFIGGSSALAITSTGLAGNGSGLTNLNATNISTGTLADTRLSANIPKLNAANTWTGNNGFGGAPTTNKVHIVGDADATGNFTADSLTISTTQREYLLGALDFPNGLNSILNFNNPRLQSTSFAASYFAPVHLPDGATVISVSCFVEDDDGDGNTTIFLIRRNEDNGLLGGTMAQVTSVGNGSQRIIDTTIGSPVIDSTQFLYFMRIDIPGASGSDSTRVASIHITYTVTQPLP